MDELTERYLILSQQVEYERDEYAFAWFELARDLDIAGRPSMAESCRARGEYYARQPEQAYTRVPMGLSLVELRPI